MNTPNQVGYKHHGKITLICDKGNLTQTNNCQPYTKCSILLKLRNVYGYHGMCKLLMEIKHVNVNKHQLGMEKQDLVKLDVYLVLNIMQVTEICDSKRQTVL